MQISQSSPSPDWLGVARGEETIRRNKRRGFMPIFFLLCARTLPSLMSVGSRYTLLLIQGAYLGRGNKYKMDPFNSVIKAVVQMVTKPRFYASRQDFFAFDGQIKRLQCFIVWYFLVICWICLNLINDNRVKQNACLWPEIHSSCISSFFVFI